MHHDAPSDDLDPIQQTLEQRFGLASFREGQRDIIEAILGGRDVVAVMPTGGGKSLCYQLPAFLLPGLTVVVSPLIALIKDQVDALQARGLPAAGISSSLSPEEQRRVLELATQGVLKLLYVAPERFRSLQFMRALASIDVSLFAVDEAHCLSQWGHDFRPDYLRLGRAIAALGRPPVAAFTATATGEVRDDIGTALQLVDPVTFFAGIDRDNLRLEFRYPSGKGGHDQKLRTLLEIIEAHRSLTGIVYASTRKNVERVYERLLAQGVRVRAYHAGLDDATRVQAQDLFMASKLQVIVATNAFGMGVDKSDIRYVVHYDFPGSIEAYYQEVGRAGRDGRPALCLTLFSEGDRFIQDYFHQGSNPPRELIEQVHRTLVGLEDDRIELTITELTQSVPGADNEMAVGTCLKVLERFGVISRGFRGESPARVKLLRPLPELLETLRRAPIQRQVAEALPVACAGRLDRGADLDLLLLASEAELEREQVLRVIGELQRAGHIDYEPPFRGRSTRVLVRDGDLGIDWNMLLEKARRDYEKIDLMIAFARSSACRKWFLRRYFTDAGGKRFCNACDRCAELTREELEAEAERLEKRLFRRRTRAGGTPAEPDPPLQSLAPARAPSHRTAPTALSAASARALEGDTLRLVQTALSAVARSQGRIGRVKVAKILKGSREQDIQRWQGSPSFGALADLSLDDLTALLDALLSSRLLESQDADEEGPFQRPVVALSELGRAVMVGKEPARVLLPGRLGKKEGTEPVRSARSETSSRASSGGAAGARDSSRSAASGGGYSARVFDALSRWRRQTAERDGVAPFMVLHNTTLRELAIVRPTTLEALLQVKGIGEARCRRYGEALVSIILEQSRLDPGR